MKCSSVTPPGILDIKYLQVLSDLVIQQGKAEREENWQDLEERAQIQDVTQYLSATL